MSHATGITTLGSTSFDNTLGAILIGALFSMTLWGVTCTQTYDYFMDNTDGRLQRSIVALLWVIDTCSSAMHSHIAYHYLVTLYANPSSIQNATWSLNLHSLVAGISNFIIRSMFARRIYQFGRKNTIIPAWIILISICDLAISLVIATKAFQGALQPKVMQSISKLLYMSFALGVTADLSVTIALSWLLQSAKSGFRKSDSVVNVLMAYVVNTGLLVTVLATVGLITYIVMPHNLVFLALFILVGKLYINAYLATLNARRRLGGKHSDSGVRLGTSLGRDTQAGVSTTDEKRRTIRGSALAISFQKTVERRVDDVSEEDKQPPDAV